MHPTLAAVLFFGLPLVWLALLCYAGWRLWRDRRYIAFRWRRWRIERARAYLDKFDEDQILQNNQYELVRRREQMRRKGIGPGDPRYPDIWDVIGEEPVIPLPHRTERLKARGQLQA